MLLETNIILLKLQARKQSIFDSDEHLRDMKYTVHDLKVIDLNPGRVKFGVCSPSV